MSNSPPHDETFSRNGRGAPKGIPEYNWIENPDSSSAKITPNSVQELTTTSRVTTPPASATVSTATYEPTSRPTLFGTEHEESKGFQKTREYVEDEIRDFILSPAAGLWDTFFPLQNDDHDHLAQFKVGDDPLFAGSGELGYAKKSAPRDTRIPQWVKLNQTSQEGKHIAEADIVDNFVEILNKIIESLGLSDTRVAVDRQNFRIPTRDGGGLSCDAFVWGKGSPAFKDMEGKPREKSQKKQKRKRAQDGDDEGSRALKDMEGKRRQKSPKKQEPKRAQGGDDAGYQDQEEEPPLVDWAWCVFPVEVKTSRNRGGPNNRKSIYQLGTYVREVFVAQPNRRFVPSLLLTEKTAEFVWWDRAGVVVSHRLNYTTHARWFCSILASMVQWDDAQLGFDPSIFYRGNKLYIQTRQPSDYVVEETLCHSYTLRGPALICWRVRKLDSQGNETSDRFIIRDLWLKCAELETLRKVEEARRQNNLGPEIDIEDVTVCGRNGPQRDTVNTNRRGDTSFVPTDMIHTLTIMRGYCVALEKFRTPLQLLRGLRDIVRDLQTLHLEAGVVHRTIAPWNILLLHGVDGQKAILLGFWDAAIMKSEIIAGPLEKDVASHLFSSRNSLLRLPSNSYMEDLETIYWLICFIAAGHEGGDLAATRLIINAPPELQNWSAKAPARAALSKDQHFAGRFQLPLQPWFLPFATVIEAMHQFFHDLYDKIGDDDEGITPKMIAKKNFASFLGIIEKAIEDKPVAVNNQNSGKEGSDRNGDARNVEGGIRVGIKKEDGNEGLRYVEIRGDSRRRRRKG